MVRGKDGFGAADPGGIEIFGQYGWISRGADGRESDAETGTHRSAANQRDWERVLRRDSSRGALSPVTLTHKLKAGGVGAAVWRTRSTLTPWMERFVKEAEKAFPEEVTAFRPEMAVHGKFDQPCPRWVRRCSGFATRTTRPTTAPAARRAARCLPTQPLAAAGIRLAADVGRTGIAEAALNAARHALLQAIRQFEGISPRWAKIAPKGNLGTHLKSSANAPGSSAHRSRLQLPRHHQAIADGRLPDIEIAMSSRTSQRPGARRRHSSACPRRLFSNGRPRADRDAEFVDRLRTARSTSSSSPATCAYLAGLHRGLPQPHP